jgi:hypothetical protein
MNHSLLQLVLPSKTKRIIKSAALIILGNKSQSSVCPQGGFYSGIIGGHY